MYAMIMFVIFSRLACRRVRQPAGAKWLSIILCDLRVNESPCNCFTLLLRVALVVVAIVGGQPWDGATMMEIMPEMEIMLVLWRWRSKAQEERPYHITIMNCM